MKAAVYAGSFDPFTHGHLAIATKATSLFERVWVLVARHPTKAPTFALTERVGQIEHATRHLPQVRVAQTGGLVVDFARAHEATYLVRGVRGAGDTATELALASENQRLAPEIQTLLLPTDPRWASVSSSALKRLARRGDDLSMWCAPAIAARLRQALGSPQRRAAPRR